MLINKLDVTDIFNLILCDKYLYNLYKSNELLINKLLIIKILVYFNFSAIGINNIKKNILDNEIYDISRIMFKKYNYFKQHRFCYKSDFIIFMLENNIDSDILFNLYISECKFLSCVKDKRIIRIIDYDESVYNEFYDQSLETVGYISISDMEYILEKTNINQLFTILKTFNIPIKMLSTVIKEMLIKEMLIKEMLTKGDYTLNKMKLFIDYLFYKHCFKHFNNIDIGNIHSIVVDFIYYKKTELLKYFLQKKNKYYIGRYKNLLDYQYIINKCIEYEDTTHLELIIKENANENNTNENNTNELKQFVIVSPSIIIKLCKKGSFSYVKYIVDTLLGQYINSNVYIKSICEGLTNIQLMDDIIKKDKLKEFKYLYDSVSCKNKQIINEHLDDDKYLD
jgi:hypothetical protein